MSLRHLRLFPPIVPPDEPGPDIGQPGSRRRIVLVAAAITTVTEVFVLAGKGTAYSEAGEVAVSEGMAVLVPGGVTHRFTNTGTELMRFICLVPQEWLEHARHDQCQEQAAKGCQSTGVEQ